MISSSSDFSHLIAAVIYLLLADGDEMVLSYTSYIKIGNVAYYYSIKTIIPFLGS